jgi:hypothetical protein
MKTTIKQLKTLIKEELLSETNIGDACPDCQQSITYIGLGKVECDTPGCSNGPMGQRSGWIFGKGEKYILVQDASGIDPIGNDIIVTYNNVPIEKIDEPQKFIDGDETDGTWSSALTKEWVDWLVREAQTRGIKWITYPNHLGDELYTLNDFKQEYLQP